MSQIQTLLAQIFALDQNSVILVTLICLACTYLLKEQLTGPWGALAAFPALLFTGLSSYVLIRDGGFDLTGDRSINVVIGATFGMILSTLLAVCIYRISTPGPNKKSAAPK